jgi:hypothetical protein
MEAQPLHIVKESVAEGRVRNELGHLCSGVIWIYALRDEVVDNLREGKRCRTCEARSAMCAPREPQANRSHGQD